LHIVADREGLMLARLATFNPAPAGIDEPNIELLRETIKSTPGFIAGFHLLNEETGIAHSLVVVENARAFSAVRDALAARPADKRVGVDPDEVQFLTARPF
jgi:hypothetical protein